MIMRQISSNELLPVSGGTHPCHILAGAWGAGVGTMFGAVISLVATPAAGATVGVGTGIAGYAAGVAILCDEADDALAS
jgi:hypothetical protein